ncbi:MAG: tetratricopeptide repeat protein [Planctomycetota bacterium]
MDADGFRRVRAAFEAALNLAQDERAPFLARELGDADELRGEAERMLAAHGTAATFLRPPGDDTLASAHARAAPALALTPGASVGDFELLRPLGGGGMGEVWVARQRNPERTVALKALRAGLTTERARRRFAEEAELLAKLSHPGIARVLASGVLGDDDGKAGDAPPRPWFAMELVPDARTFTDAARAAPLARRIELMLQLCDAVHHGHLRGVVHRDLKPDNVLVDPDGGVRVIDFGIGRAIDVTGATQPELTAHGEVLGTLAYMSPEQIRGERDRVDVRTDVHALGVLLYEVLSGRSPWRSDRSSWTSLAREVAEIDPPPPSRAGEELPGVTRPRARELDWVVARALAKEPEARYASAGELADELRRFLADEPLRAGPPSLAYTARKFARRNRAWVAGGAVAFALLLLGSAGTAGGWLRALDREEKLDEARLDAEEKAARATALNRYLDGMLRAANPFDQAVGSRGETTIAEMLDRAAATLGSAFPGRPLLEAETRMLIGFTYDGQGRAGEAIEQFDRAAELFEAALPARAADLVQARRASATTLGRGGRAEDAVARLGELHAFAAEHLGSESAEHARLAVDLGWALQEAGRFEEALPVLRSALAEFERAGRWPAVAQATLNLARTLRQLGQVDEAEASYRRAIELLRREFGPRAPNVGLALGNFGSFLYAQDRLEESREALAESLAIQREVLSPTHPLLGQALSNLSGVLATLGELEAAEELNLEALEVLRAALGDDDESTASALNNLAFLHSDLGRWSEAADEYDAFADYLRRHHGPDYWRVVLTDAYAAESRAMAGDRTDAAEELEALYHRAADLFGTDGDATRGVVRAARRSFDGPEHAALRAPWEARKP